jgi:hypothetical protein
MFEKHFGKYVSQGDKITCEVDGFKCTATVYHDDNMEPPWERDDGHGPVSDWTTRDKLPGERVIASDQSHKRFYDFAAAVALARKDGWDTKPFGQGTAGEQAARAAEADFKRLKAWCDDEWHYVGVTVTVEKAGVRLNGQYENALWGMESDAGDYLREVANELLDDALDAARAKLAELCADTDIPTGEFDAIDAAEGGDGLVY